MYSSFNTHLISSHPIIRSQKMTRWDAFLRREWRRMDTWRGDYTPVDEEGDCLTRGQFWKIGEDFYACCMRPGSRGWPKPVWFWILKGTVHAATAVCWTAGKISRVSSRKRQVVGLINMTKNTFKKPLERSSFAFANHDTPTLEKSISNTISIDCIGMCCSPKRKISFPAKSDVRE